MPSNPDISTADARDRHANILAVGVFLMGIKYGADAVMHFVSPGIGSVLNVVGGVLALVAVALVLTILIWKVRKVPRNQRDYYFGTDGFVASVINRAHLASWGATLLLLVALEVVGPRFDHLPAEFFLQTTLAVMLGSFSIAFLQLNRAADNSGAGELTSA